MLAAVDLGAPSSYLALRPGSPVYSCDGEKLGAVEHVLAEPKVDIFDGIVIDRSALPGGNRFVDAPEVEEIFERGVLLKITAAQARDLPVPEPNPATMSAEPGDLDEGELGRKLRKAWERISGG